jgi:hypothetical protein
MKKLILIIIPFILIACAGQSTAPVSKQERSAASQSQRDLAFQDLDEGETPYAVKTKLTPAQQKALEAHRELDCSIKGNCPLPASAVEVPPSPAPSPAVESPVTVSEKPRPGNTVALAERPGKTKYPILNGFPVWFSTPVYDGYFGGVGVAKPQRGGLPAQRKVAVALAQADLARNIEVTVNSVAESERTLTDTKTASAYAERFSTMSRQETEQLLANPTIMDEWLNEITGELYVWVVIK